MRGASDKAVFDELDDRRMVHWCVRNVMPPDERRDDDVRYSEAELRRKPMHRGRIIWVGAGVSGCEVAVQCRRAAGGNAWTVTVGIDGNRGDIGDGAERGIGKVVRVPRHWRNVVVWASAFVIAQEEDRILPGRTGHLGIDDGGDLRLADQNRLTRAGVLVIKTVSTDPG